MDEFTKGPWFVSDGKPYLVIKGKVCVSGEDGEPIVVADTNYYFEESRANAALIAAAPEMYELLKKSADELLFMIRKANSDLIQSITSTTESEPDYHDEQTVFEIMQLLAKARGEK